jgi:hypothetical protein
MNTAAFNQETSYHSDDWNSLVGLLKSLKEMAIRQVEPRKLVSRSIRMTAERFSTKLVSIVVRWLRIPASALKNAHRLVLAAVIADVAADILQCFMGGLSLEDALLGAFIRVGTALATVATPALSGPIGVALALLAAHLLAELRSSAARVAELVLQLELQLERAMSQNADILGKLDSLQSELLSVHADCDDTDQIFRSAITA